MVKKKRFRVTLDNDLMVGAKQRLGKSTSGTIEKGLRLIIANYDGHAQAPYFSPCMGEKNRFRISLDSDLVAAAERRVGKPRSEVIEKGLQLIIANYDGHAQATGKLLELENKLKENTRTIEWLCADRETLKEEIKKIPRIVEITAELISYIKEIIASQRGSVKLTNNNREDEVPESDVKDWVKRGHISQAFADDYLSRLMSRRQKEDGNL